MNQEKFSQKIKMFLFMQKKNATSANQIINETKQTI